jgi:REP element-mobilizing transposase RayT
MSERYKVIDSSTPTFITLTIIGWIDLFTKPNYTKILDEALNHCVNEKGLSIHAYVYMTSHIHLIVSSSEPIQDIVRDFKRHTSREIIKSIKEQPESRREWLLNKMSFEADRIKRNSKFKVWQDGFHPVILDTPIKLEQRIKYIHDNPRELELVSDPIHWINSSILAYTDEDHQSNVQLDALYG